MSKELENLRTLTENLPDVASLLQLVKKRIGPSISYSAEKGESIEAWCLHNNGLGAARLSFMLKGSKIQKHAHLAPIVEWLIVISGNVQCFNDNLSDKLLGPADAIKFESGQIHSIEALKDTWLYGITIPADKGYPNE